MIIRGTFYVLVIALTVASVGWISGCGTRLQAETATPGEAPATTPATSPTAPPANNMSNTNANKNIAGGDAVDGIWGGTGISYYAEDGTVTLQFDCGSATISPLPRMDKSGQFDVVGEFTREGPGPIRVDHLPKPMAIRFKGKIDGKRMDLSGKFVESGDDVGPFVLQEGVTGRVRKCR